MIHAGGHCALMPPETESHVPHEKPVLNFAFYSDNYAQFFATEAEAVSAAEAELATSREQSKINGVWDGWNDAAADIVVMQVIKRATLIPGLHYSQDEYVLRDVNEWFTADQVNIQGEWWYWNGCNDCAPVPCTVFYSGCIGKFFTTMGQLGWTEPMNVIDRGGLWKFIPDEPIPKHAAWKLTGK
jgi:hypothetical protein